MAGLRFPVLTRREAIRKTVYFGAGTLMARWLPGRAQAAPPETGFSGPGLNLLAVGDFGWGARKSDCQGLVARAMARFGGTLGRPLDAIFALGDNFYGKMTPDRFQRDFEQMYDAAALPCPFYACIGNHDYELASYGLDPEPFKYQAQLAYARDNPASRWKMPAKWYALELPGEQPLLKVIVLDGNVQEGALTPQEKLEQKRFLEAELAKGTKAPWLWLVWHFPPFTETTKRKDDPGRLRILDKALKKYPVSMLLAGHDHNLQHLRVEGYSTDFIVSGAGGARRYEVTSSMRGFSKMDLGFNHFHITPERITTQFLNAEGECLYAFNRYLDGRAEILP